MECSLLLNTQCRGEKRTMGGGKEGGVGVEGWGGGSTALKM